MNRKKMTYNELIDRMRQLEDSIWRLGGKAKENSQNEYNNLSNEVQWRETVEWKKRIAEMSFKDFRDEFLQKDYIAE